MIRGSMQPTQHAHAMPDLLHVAIQDADTDVGMPDWLTPEELLLFAAFRVPKRQREWLAGRRAAKEIVRRRHGLHGPEALAGIQIGSVRGGLEHGRPVYTVHGHPGPFALSITHCGGVALAALARRENLRLGVDLEVVQPRGESFEAVALSPSELLNSRGLCGETRWRAITRIWVLKEALLKAIGIGLRLPLPLLSVRCAGDGSWSAELDAISFSVDPRARHLHPLLRNLDRAAIAAIPFALGEALGACVVMPPWEETCSPC
jgi:4'-phosphopantetheinyl transferase